MAPRRLEALEEVVTKPTFCFGVKCLWFKEVVKPEEKGAVTARTATVENFIVVYKGLLNEKVDGKEKPKNAKLSDTPKRTNVG